MLKAGISGAGYIATHHVKGLESVPGVQIAGVCDLSLSKAREFVKNLPGVRAYSSLDEMLTVETLDVVHVLTPPDSHAEASEKIIAKGVHVFLEKPMAVTENECNRLNLNAQEHQVHIGVNHNFLFYPAYQQLKRALLDKKLGTLDHITVTWQKNMDQIKRGPFGIWMLREPQNLWLETGPHLCSILLDLAGEVQHLHVETGCPLQLPSGNWIYRRWIVTGKAGSAFIEIRLSFTQGFEERSVEIRGQAGFARVDFERNTFQLKRHTQYSQPFDLYYMNKHENKSLLRQGHQFIHNYIKSKLKLTRFGDPYTGSIAESIAVFYRNLKGKEDSRQTGKFGEQVTGLCEKIAGIASLEHTKVDAIKKSNPGEPSQILVLGGTGFIGQALTRQLLRQGRKVRVLARDTDKLALLSHEGELDLVRGDILNEEALKKSLKDVKYVFHLATAHVKTREDYLQYDVEPTRIVGEACLSAGIERLIYTGTIDSYYAGRAGEKIDENTPLDPGLQNRNYYAQAKAAGEQILMKMHREQGLPVVIIRPGIVLGAGGSPFHWGVGMWHYETVCQFWGKGDHPLPFVLMDDIVQGLILSLEKQNIAGHSFNLVDIPCLSAREYVKALEEALGAEIKALATPVWKFYLIECLKWLIKVLVRHYDRRSPSWRDWSSRTQQATYDCSKALKHLGWKPAGNRDIILEEGVRKPAQYWWS